MEEIRQTGTEHFVYIATLFQNSCEGTTTPRDWKDRGFHVTQAKPENLFQLSLAVIYLFCLRYLLQSTIAIVMS